MSTEQNKAVLRGWVEAMNTRDLAALDTLAEEAFAAEYTVHDPGIPDFRRGPDGVRQWLRGAFKRWPDMQITIEKMVAEGDTVAWCFVVQGSKANGQVARFWALSMIRFVAGKMAEEWEITAPVEAQP